MRNGCQEEKRSKENLDLCSSFGGLVSTFSYFSKKISSSPKGSFSYAMPHLKLVVHECRYSNQTFVSLYLMCLSCMYYSLAAVDTVSVARIKPATAIICFHPTQLMQILS